MANQTKQAAPKVVALASVSPIPGTCGRSWELLNTHDTDAKNVSMALVTVEPGHHAQPHLHRLMEEMYFIVEGEGEVTVGSMQSRVASGSAVFIPPGNVHSITNVGQTTIRLLAVNSPPFDPSDVYLAE